VKVVAYDTETVTFSPGRMAPPLVCVSYQSPGEEPGLVHVKDPRCLRLLEEWLESDTIVGHHVPYDFGVVCAQWPYLIPKVFKAYDEDRIEDTKIRQQLLDIAGGCFRGKLHKFSREVTKEDGTVEVVTGAVWQQYNYDLDAVCYRATGRRLEKDEWRLRYGEFIDVPIEQWPEGARVYPKEDARATLDVRMQQEVHLDFIEDQYRQARGAWALHLTQTWGLRTHGPSVERLERETIAALDAIEDGLKEAGLVRADGSRNTRLAQARMVAVCRASGKPIRLTDSGEVKFKEISETGQFVEKKKNKSDVVIPVPADGVYEFIASKGGICLDSDACAASDDDLLEDYSEASSLKKMISNEIPMLKEGVTYPVHTSYGMAASARSTSSGPNVQNPKRSGDVLRNGKIKYTLPDVRECWMPREGKVFAQADFDQMELHSLGQVCLTLFGESKLAEALNAGIDPHTLFACKILNISYEEGKRRRKDKSDKDFDNARQVGKVFNFGTPGGLGAEKLCLYGRKTYQVNITPDEARARKKDWLEQWPEMVKYFQYVGDLIDKDTGEGIIQQLFTNRWRGGCHYTSACNGFFQSLAADAAKRALYLVVRACYAEPDNVLYGSRPVLFCHDEIVAEVDDDRYAHDKAVEMSRLMCLGANEYVPDVPAKADPVLATRWSKKMTAVFGPDGRLIPWSPEMAA
jgi:DNA polymerase I